MAPPIAIRADASVLFTDFLYDICSFFWIECQLKHQVRDRSLGQGTQRRRDAKEGGDSFLAKIFGKSQKSVGLSRATGTGTCDWEWSGRGSVQDDGRQATQADECQMECGQTERNGCPVLRTLLESLGKILDASKLNAKTTTIKTLMHPIPTCKSSPT